MEIDRLNYGKLIIACLSYFRLEEVMIDISGGLTGDRVKHISAVCDVARAFSIYANRYDGDEEDDELFLKFKDLLEADLSLEKKIEILLGLGEDNIIVSDENEYDKLQMKCLEKYHNQIFDK